MLLRQSVPQADWLAFKWDIEAKEWYIMLADATPTVATDLNEICSEWGLTVTGVTEF